GAAELFDLGVHHVHTHTAPGDLGNFVGGTEASMQNKLDDVLITQLCIFTHQAALKCFLAYPLQVDATAIVSQAQHDVATFAAKAQNNPASGGLAGSNTFFSCLNTVVDCVAQHVLQRRHHAFQNCPVQFAFDVVQLKLDFFAEFGGGLAHDTAQARHQPGEGHHARTHQSFLQVRVDSGLLQQQGFSVTGFIGQGELKVHQVRCRFDQRARQLLQLRVAVHLQRVEVFVGRHLLLTEQNLGFGFDIESTQLLLQTLNSGIHLLDSAAEVTDLLLHPTPADRSFPRQVNQLFEQFSGDLHHFLGTTAAGC